MTEVPLVGDGGSSLVDDAGPRDPLWPPPPYRDLALEAQQSLEGAEVALRWSADGIGPGERVVHGTWEPERFISLDDAQPPESQIGLFGGVEASLGWFEVRLPAAEGAEPQIAGAPDSMLLWTDEPVPAYSPLGRTLGHELSGHRAYLLAVRPYTRPEQQEFEQCVARHPDSPEQRCGLDLRFHIEVILDPVAPVEMLFDVENRSLR